MDRTHRVLAGSNRHPLAQCVDGGAEHQRQAFKNRPAPNPIPTVAPITVADALVWPVIVVTSFNDPLLSELALGQPRLELGNDLAGLVA